MAIVGGMLAIQYWELRILVDEIIKEDKEE